MSAPVVEWRCDTSRGACLVVAVSPSPEGPQATFRRYRVSPEAAARTDRQCDGERTAGDPHSVPLERLLRSGAFGKTCRHYEFVSLSSHELQSDYDLALAEHRQVRRFLRA